MMQPHCVTMPLLLRHSGVEARAHGAARVLQQMGGSAGFAESAPRHGFESDVVGRRPDA
jgi:hypothetical protein